jgi:lipopolysaccharide export system protein LptA
MSYTINKTDGSILTTVIDGTVDQTATDITLIGKNSSTYGESLNENFIKILENFASGTAPTKPIAGQLWFDTTENRLKVYDGNLFKVSGGTIVSNEVPTNPVAGDLWIDTQRQQLFFYDGNVWFLAGPIYSASQGVSGFNVTTVLDDINTSHTIVLLYVDTVLIGLFAKEAFTPLGSIPGFAGDVVAGFNIGSASGLMFNTPVETATNLKSPDDELFTTEDFVHTLGNSVIDQGSLTIQYDTPLILGPAQNNQINVDSNSFDIVGNNSGQNISIKVKPPTGQPKGLTLYNPIVYSIETTEATGDGVTATLSFVEQIAPPFAINDIIEVKFIIPDGYRGTYVVTDCTTTTVSFANTTTQVQSTAGAVQLSIEPRLGILTDVPLATLDVNGNAIIQGNLIVLGDTTTIHTATLSVTDKNIELAKPDDNTSPTDQLADGGGITLRGTTDKLFSWRYNALATNTYWNSSENLNLASGKTYKIDGVDVLTATSLGSNITSAPGISSLGTLNNLTIANFTITGNTISAAAGDLILAPAGGNTVDVSNKRITNVGTAGAGTDAVNRDFLYSTIKLRPLGMSLNINNASGGVLTDTQIIGVVQEVFPAGEYAQNTVCRVHCTEVTVTYSSIEVTISDTDPAANISKGFATVDQSPGTASVVSDINWQNNIDAGDGTVKTTRTLKTYTVNAGGNWEFTSSVASSVIV